MLACEISICLLIFRWSVFLSSSPRSLFDPRFATFTSLSLLWAITISRVEMERALLCRHCPHPFFTPFIYFGGLHLNKIKGNGGRLSKRRHLWKKNKKDLHHRLHVTNTPRKEQHIHYKDGNVDQKESSHHHCHPSSSSCHQHPSKRTTIFITRMAMVVDDSFWLTLEIWPEDVSHGNMFPRNQPKFW